MSDRYAIDLVTHSCVMIERPATAIWPSIVDVNDWKLGAKLWHQEGPVGEPGEIFAAGDPANPGAVSFLAENVELVPGQRRTMKLYLPSGVLMGFASWRLVEIAGRTEVTYDVVSEYRLEPEQVAAMTGEQRRQYQIMNQERFDQELAGLKRLVETGSAQAA